MYFKVVRPKIRLTDANSLGRYFHKTLTFRIRISAARELPITYITLFFANRILLFQFEIVR